MLTLDHLEIREQVREAMSLCCRTQHYWLLYRKHIDNGLDIWYGALCYGDNFMSLRGKVYPWPENHLYTPQPIHFHYNLVHLLPKHILSNRGRNYGYKNSYVFKSLSGLRHSIYTYEQDNFIPYGFQYLNVKRPVDVLTQNVEQVNWSPNVSTGLNKNAQCVFKLPSVEATYKLGHMVVFEEWYQQNKTKHLVVS